MRITLAVAVLALPCAIHLGCSQSNLGSEVATPPDSRPSATAEGEAAREPATWLTLQEEIACTLERDSGEEHWHVEPVAGAAPEIGEVLGTSAVATIDIGVSDWSGSVHPQFTQLRFRAGPRADNASGAPANEVVTMRWVGGEFSDVVLNESDLETAFSTLAWLDGPPQ